MNAHPARCDNYQPPLTCLTAPSSESGRCASCANSSERESLEESVRAVLAGNGGTMGAVAESLRMMGLGKS
jgi:hypothetical protein